MPTIIEQTPNGLYKQPDRTVATFPSGLVRIDQTYICANAAEATHRATLAVGNELPDDDGYPAIDGAFIFPHCQQVRRGSGFTEFVASAYGRTSTAPTNFITSVVQIGDPTTAAATAISFKVLNFTCDVVGLTADGLSVDTLNLSDDLLDPFDYTYGSTPFEPVGITNPATLRTGFPFVDADGNPVQRNYTRRRIFTVTTPFPANEAGDLATVTFVVYDPTIKIVSQSNFGKFTEYKIEVIQAPQLGSLYGTAP